MFKIEHMDLWEALGKIYLKDFEIMEYYREGDGGNRKVRKKILSLIKRRLFEDLLKKMQQYGENEPPFLMKQDFIRNECKAIIKEVEDVKFGRMDVGYDSFTIYVNKKLPYVQKRTLIAHELGHTFLYDRNRYPLEPLYRRKSDVDLLFTKDAKDVEYIYKADEGFIYEIGRFLLIPSGIMEKYIPRSPSIGSFMSACKTFLTTKDVMARRLFWDIYDWDEKTNYWKNSCFIIYPIQKIKDKEFPPPYENTEIFKGSLFKNFNVRKVWSLLIPMLKITLNNAEKTIKSEDLRELSQLKSIKFKREELKIEMKYVPRDYRVYILLYPNKGRE